MNLNELPFEEDAGWVLPTAGDYADFQGRYGIEVPGALRRLLECRNGGRVRKLWVASRNSALKEGLCVSRFLSLKAEDYSPTSIVGCMRGWRDAMGRMGQPFAEDPEGNLFFLDTATNPAQVKYAKQDSDIQVFTVSPDLDTFLQGLHEVREEEEENIFLYHGADKDVVSQPPVSRKRGYALKATLIGLGLFWLLNYWTSRPIWEDGNLRVYDMDGEFMLGTYHDPGYFGLLDEQVVAVGSNDQWVVAQQWREGSIGFYFLKKPTEDLTPSDVLGPYTREEYEREVVARGLPPFTWQNPWVKH